MDRYLAHPAVKPVVFVTALIPFGILAQRMLSGHLGANPVETITHWTGLWALRFLLITLAITPIRDITGWQRLGRLRRMVGLFTFFYAVLHACTYFVFDHYFDWTEIGRDVIKRPYVTVGFASFLLLIPLAITSTNRMAKRLGGRRWRRLHQAVYIISVLVILHFLWLVKAELREPLIYATLLLILLAARIRGSVIRHEQTQRHHA
jgi:sulfoxide reductase heme-binding subunit YedZ